MDPHQQFCPNPACPARGQSAQGNISIHDSKRQLYTCAVCGHAFSARRGTPFFRQHTDPTLIALIITLIVHGCPVEAVVAAYGFQARTVRRWVSRAGIHAQDLKGHVAKDHGHLFVSIPPQVAVSRLVQRLKGKSSYKLLQEYPRLHKAFWGQHL